MADYTPEQLAEWLEDCAEVSRHPTIVARYRAAAALLRTMAENAEQFDRLWAARDAMGRFDEPSSDAEQLPGGPDGK